MDIRLATDKDRTVWDAYVLGHEDGLAYHQYAWKEAVAAAYHFKARYLVAEKTGDICGVLPMIDFKRPLGGHSFVSLPYCDQGGCLADDPDIATALMVRARALADADNVESIELRQVGRQNGTQLGRQDDCDYQSVEGQKVRMILDLPTSSSLLLAGLKSKLRSQIRKPARDGLVAVLGGLELVPEFYQIFSENMRALGSPVHSRKWIESIVKYYAMRARVGLVYTPEGEPAAGGVILLHGKSVSIPWASSLRKFNKLNPNMLLYWNFLAFAADQGFGRFDFGRSTPGEGTYRFKAQWGARPVALDWRRIGHQGVKKLASTQKSELRGQAENIWKHLPLALCNTCGPLLRRYVSL